MRAIFNLFRRGSAVQSGSKILAGAGLGVADRSQYGGSTSNSSQIRRMPCEALCILAACCSTQIRDTMSKAHRKISGQLSLPYASLQSHVQPRSQLVSQSCNILMISATLLSHPRPCIPRQAVSSAPSTLLTHGLHLGVLVPCPFSRSTREATAISQASLTYPSRRKAASRKQHAET